MPRNDVENGRLSGRPVSRSLAPLRSILPFLKPYRWRIVVGHRHPDPALFARGLIDHGFNAREAGEVSRYFLAFIAAAAVLGISAATRFYFVTWLGERVTADIRVAVFANVLGLTPAFFEVTRTGEVLSRLTADTTLVQTVIGSSASMALRNVVTLTGGLALMCFTSFKLTLLIVGAVILIMLPLIFFGRWVRTLSRKSQDRLADTSAHASETLNAVQTVQVLHSRRAGARQLCPGGGSFLRYRHRADAGAGLHDGGGDLLDFLSSLAAVGWVGAQDILAHKMTGGILLQFILYGGPGGGRRGRPV